LEAKNSSAKKRERAKRIPNGSRFALKRKFYFCETGAPYWESNPTVWLAQETRENTFNFLTATLLTGFNYFYKLMYFNYQRNPPPLIPVLASQACWMRVRNIYLNYFTDATLLSKQTGM
jgi:hypothetical protein